MKMLFRGALTLASVVLLSGCADLVTGGPLIIEGVPTGAIQINNQTSGDLNVVLISACSASSYGLNRMSDGEYISPGYARQFEVSAGCWDVGAGATGVGDAFERMDVRAGYVTSYTITE